MDCELWIFDYRLDLQQWTVDYGQSVVDCEPKTVRLAPSNTYQHCLKTAWMLTSPDPPNRWTHSKSFCKSHDIVELKEIFDQQNGRLSVAFSLGKHVWYRQSKEVVQWSHVTILRFTFQSVSVSQIVFCTILHALSFTAHCV